MLDTIHQARERYIKEVGKENVVKIVGLIKGFLTEIICINNGLMYMLIQIMNFHISTERVKKCGCLTTVYTE